MDTRVIEMESFTPEITINVEHELDDVRGSFDSGDPEWDKKDEEEFRQDAYYKDLVSEATNELADKLDDLQGCKIERIKR